MHVVTHSQHESVRVLTPILRCVRNVVKAMPPNAFKRTAADNREKACDAEVSRGEWALCTRVIEE